MSRALLAGTAALGAGAAVAAVVLARTGDNAETTYAGTTRAAAAAMLVAALALFAAAPLARSRALSALAAAAGVCWLAPILVGWPTGPASLRAAATLAAAFTVPLLLHLALAAPSGRLRGRTDRAVLTATYIWVALIAVLLALVRDPFYDPNCWSDCDGNAFLTWRSRGLADTLLDIRPWGQLTFGALAIGLGARRLTSRTILDRAIGLAASAVGAVAALHALSLLSNPLEQPLDQTFRAIFFATCAAIVLVASALVLPSVLGAWRRRAVRQVVAELGAAPAPEELERTLGGIIGDSTLRLVFPLPDAGGYVDVSGTPCDLPAPHRAGALTPLTRRGQPVAWIAHDPLVAEAIAPALSPGVRLALDNAHLATVQLAQLRELREARQKVVLDGDAERRRLERDLHDGVQQQLLALGAELRAAIRWTSDSDAEARRRLERTVEETVTLLAEVRSLAHGIYPAILTDGGLAPAIASLADVARLPITIVRTPTRRYDASVEMTAYHVVAESVDNAVVHSNATSVAVELEERDAALVVNVHDDGRGGAAVNRVGGLAELVDRVGAIDGSIAVENPGGGGTTIRAVIPCAS